MFQRPETTNRLTGMLPLTRAAFSAMVLALLATLVLFVAPHALAQPKGRSHTVHTYDLLPQLKGDIGPDGALELLLGQEAALLLRGEPVSLVDSRRRRSADVFHLLSLEGAPNGQRGFSSRADDDGDGLIDEDRLDGRDNDGDGRIDEDFAAVSDGMVSVHLRKFDNREGDLHAEYYHWAYPHLRTAVFVNVGAERVSGATYRYTTMGSEWREIDVVNRRHTAKGHLAQGEGRAFVSRVLPTTLSPVDDVCGSGSATWVGVMILDPATTDRISLANRKLDVLLSDAMVPAVVCAAESWLQLNRLLSEAAAVFQGVTDPVTNRQTGWVVPPSCSVCRQLEDPVFGWDRDENGVLEITADITPSGRALLDPDMFRIDDLALGSPESLVWTPRFGSAVTLPWECVKDAGQLGDPTSGSAFFNQLLGLLGHGATGRLVFRFPPTTSASVTQAATMWEEGHAVRLATRFLDGRPVVVDLEGRDPLEVQAPAGTEGDSEIDASVQGYAEDRARALEASPHPPTLAPDLLQGWPNPFNEVIRIRFEVPGTMKQAFVWKKLADQPANLNLDAAVPWPSGQPQVSVKIYTINGQELVTLYSGSQEVGDYSVQWNGTDASGRPVASGTYFCKLQLDNWSVTRRLVYLR